MRVVSKVDSPLLSRSEVIFEMDFIGSTPKKDDIKKEISKNLKVEENLIKIKRIKQKYGVNKIKVTAYAYKDLESLEKIETVKKRKKKEKKESADKPEKLAKEEKVEEKAKEKSKEEK